MGAGRKPLSSELGRIVEEAYDLFACPPPPDLGVCRFCCMSPEIETDFLNHGPRDLPDSYVADWYFAAVAGKDGVVVHKPIANWIMPKVLDMLARGAEPAYVGDEVVLQRLAAGQQERWSQSQIALLHRFQWAYIDQLPDRDSCVMLDDVMCMFALAGFDTKPMTDRVMSWQDETLVGVLWRNWINTYNSASIWRTAFWEANAPPAQHVWNWYLSEELLDRVTRAALDDNLSDNVKRQAAAVEQVIRDNR